MVSFGRFSDGLLLARLKALAPDKNGAKAKVDATLNNPQGLILEFVSADAADTNTQSPLRPSSGLPGTRSIMAAVVRRRAGALPRSSWRSPRTGRFASSVVAKSSSASPTASSGSLMIVSTPLGLGGFYTSTNTEIVGKNGSVFLFAGLKHNVTKIKSVEGIDIAWLEEGDRISRESLDILIPTIRKPGSEIWITFNPNEPTDPVYQDFVLADPPRTNAIVKMVNYEDNPFFPDVLREEMEWDQAHDTAKYLHVWEGYTPGSVRTAWSCATGGWRSLKRRQT